MKSRLLRTLTGIFALAATAGTLEYTAYSAFDREDGTNFICDIDPSCHYLTEGEIDFATQVYGDSIDFTNVKKFSRAWFFFPEERDMLFLLFMRWGMCVNLRRGVALSWNF